MSAMTAYFISPLSHDFESAKPAARRTNNFFLALNQPTESGFANRLAKRVQLLALTLGNQLDASVVQVADRAGHFVSRRDRLHRVAKPDSLHSARVKNRHSLAAHGPNLRGGDEATSAPTGARNCLAERYAR